MTGRMQGAKTDTVHLSSVIEVRIKRIGDVGKEWSDIEKYTISTFGHEPEDIVAFITNGEDDIYETRWNWGPRPGGVLHGMGQGHYVPGPARTRRVK